MESEDKKTLQYLLWNGVATAAADTVSSGTILIAFATMFGAGNFYLGVIVSLPFFANLMNFFVSFLLEKGHTCKEISIISSILSKPMYLIIAFLPFFCNKNQLLTALFICVFMLYFSGNITGGAFSVWVKRVIPEKILGIFFAKRYGYMMIARIFCYTGVYILLKHLRSINENLQVYAYSVMFLLAFALGVFTIITFFLMQDKSKTEIQSGFLKNLILGFKDKTFRGVVFYVGIFNFFMNFFFPFVSVYMLKSLNYSMDMVIAITILFQIAYIVSSKFWGNLSDKTGLKVPLVVAFCLTAICIVSFMILCWNLVQNSGLLFALILILQIILGMTNACFQLSSNNIPIICISDNKANTLIPSINAVKSFFAGIGSVFAGIFVTYSLIFENKYNLASGDGWFSFYFICFCICLYLIFSVKVLKKCDID